MQSEAQRWSSKRNWLLFRLKGVRSVFSFSDMSLIYRLLPKDKWHLVNDLITNISNLINEVSKSIYRRY